MYFLNTRFVYFENTSRFLFQDSNEKVKKRLADRLGIIKAPKKGQHLPELRQLPILANEREAAASFTGQLSLFGRTNELIGFDDENNQIEGEQ